MKEIRIRGGQERYEEISYLRGFSIFTVVLMHLIQVFVMRGDIPGWLRAAASVGGTGGHMFFFCSGFGLFLSWLRHPVDFPTFIRKRFVKIYLPYIIIILLQYILFFQRFGDERTKALMSHVFLYKMFFEKYESSFGLHFWFISTIIQFYLLFIPLCRLRGKISMRAMLTGSVFVSVAWWVFTCAAGLSAKRIWGSFCLQYLWEFVLGMAAAEHLHEGRDLTAPGWVLPVAASVGLALQAVMALAGGWAAAFNDIPGFFGYASAAFLLYRLAKRSVGRFCLWLDPFSYEFFLVHVLCISTTYQLLLPVIGSELLLAVLAVGFSLLAGWLYENFLHKVLKIV